MLGSFLRFLVQAFGRLPLAANHLIGRGIGRLAWYLSAAHRARIDTHLRYFFAWRNAGVANFDDEPLRRRAIAAQGEGLTELAYLWSQPLSVVYAKIVSVNGWEAVEAARAAGRPIIFVSPHLGCYDMAGRFIEQRVAITAIFRPPKLAWLSPLMQRGRARGGATTAPATAIGMRQVIKALKNRQSIFLLPDQVPAAAQGGEGAWADFFGHPAYTMTLLAKLARSYQCATIFVYAERLAAGAGYAIHCQPMSADFSENLEAAARETNAMVEQLILRCPAQYLWSYNRYKQPAGASVPLAPRENSASSAGG